jgi:hypothetical protein
MSNFTPYTQAQSPFQLHFPPHNLTYTHYPIPCAPDAHFFHMEALVIQIASGLGVNFVWELVPVIANKMAEHVSSRMDKLRKKRVCLLPTADAFKKNRNCFYLPIAYCLGLQNAFLSSLTHLAERCQQAIERAFEERSDPTPECAHLKVNYPQTSNADQLVPYLIHHWNFRLTRDEERT